MTHRVGPKGQVVIPKDIRERLGIGPGDDVVFQDVGDGVVVRRAGGADELRGICAGGPSTLAQWDALRRQERQFEQQRDEHLGGPSGPVDSP